VSGLVKRADVVKALKKIHDKASAEFDTAPNATRQHECNGIMEGCREVSQLVEKLNDVVPKKTADDGEGEDD